MTAEQSVERRSLRRVLVRSACAAAVATLAWGASPSGAAFASPGLLAQAQLQSATITGLSQGARGADVAALQQALMDVGVPVSGGADGVFGPATRGAVVAFQSDRGLSATGVVDEATAEALAASVSGSGSTGASTPSSGSYVGLSEGAQGDAVAAVQQRMMDLGVYVAGGADGVFGAATTRAVTQFQRWNGLGVTGTVTEATVRTLGLTGDGSGPTTSTPDPEPEPTPDSPDATANPYVGLKRGSQGQLVKDLQSTLIATGIPVRGGADGDFGGVTEAALKSFQSANGLPQTGVVSMADATALHLGPHGHDHSDDGADEPASDESTNPYVGLKVGDRGDLVKDVQQALLDRGINLLGGADGVFGNATKGGLALFQQQQSLSATGVVDAATAGALELGGAEPVGVVNNEPDPAPPSSSNPYVGLKMGSSGELVRELQVALQNTGLVVRGGADGQFGAATKSSLIAFQSVNGIQQTGVVSEKGATILGLGTGNNDSSGGGSSSAEIKMLRFPVQGQCFFGDTWHAARGGGRLHEGVDIIAPEGKLLYAVVDGHISKMYWDSPGALAGNGLRVAQDDGTYFTYLHMSGFAPGIEVGTEVKAGDVIGFVGNTGSSATAHLHFEIHPGGGAAVNPYPYVKAIDDCSNTTPQYQQSFPSPAAAPSDA
ncbi:peptidoglycan-binding protein [Ilumatobacter coccineus]|uniref:peptidoglycan-binding protein n=1 Tax=Ilumatobacter coccineus TaxID=467094 RepID=UPI0003467116|nr:peptidoglycan-binding protein [Ilumatobacter coccineus]